MTGPGDFHRIGVVGVEHPGKAFEEFVEFVRSHWPQVEWDFENRIRGEVADGAVVKWWALYRKSFEIPPLVLMIADVKMPDGEKRRKCLALARPVTRR